MTESLAGGAAAAPLSMRAAPTLTSAALKVARQILTDLERGRRIDAAVLRSAMEAAFGASDAAGAWSWKTAYDICGTAIDHHLDANVVPSVVLMNLPFSVVVNVDRRMADAALRHIASSLPRLCDGGRLVAIAGVRFAPDNPAWHEAFVRLRERGRVAFSAAIDSAVYAKGLHLRRIRMMGAYRIALSGFIAAMRDRLRAYGLFGEIISWKLLMFVATDASGVRISRRVLDIYPVARVSEREAA
ncbi:hypothetical protein XH80_27050 [Bradyrhizobium sp. CCBAU 45384]|nr:hypothetical protein [Bradyrhizobium sp. CCBAU 45384]